MMQTSSDLETFVDQLGLRHIRGSELSWLWTRSRKLVVNSVPPSHLWPNIIHPLVVLDEIRERLGRPVRITSSYRSPAYNTAVGGELMSYHKLFAAIDFTTPAGPEAASRVARQLRGTRLKLPGGGSFIWKGGIGIYPTFVHIDARGVDANW